MKMGGEGPTAGETAIGRASSGLRQLPGALSTEDFDLGAAMPGSKSEGRDPMEIGLPSGAGGTGGSGLRLTPGRPGAALTGGAVAPVGPTFSVSRIPGGSETAGAAFILSWGTVEGAQAGPRGW